MRAALTLAALSMLAGGCDWRDFESLRNAAPVTAIQPPSGFPSSADFAALLVATSPPTDGSAAARFVTSATLTTALAVVTLNPGGQASSHLVGTTSGLANLDGQPVTALAAIPGADEVLLGVPSAQGGTILMLDLSQSPETVTSFPGISPLVSAEPYLGVGLAAGNLDANPAPDLVVASASSIHVFLNGGLTDLPAGSSTACPIALPSNLPQDQRIQRAVAVGKLAGSTPVVAVGTPGVGTPGSVSLFAVDNGALTCQLSLAPPAAGATTAGFGRSLAVGDFNADGVADLLVGAPPDHAYIYWGPLAAGASATETISNPDSAGATGAAVAALNVDRMGGDEALVGDPDAFVRGLQEAGAVIVHTSTSIDPVQGAVSDNSPGAGNAYGSSVAALPFCQAPPCTSTAPILLPLVGAKNKAFVYFRMSGDDVRAQ